MYRRCPSLLLHRSANSYSRVKIILYKNVCIPLYIQHTLLMCVHHLSLNDGEHIEYTTEYIFKHNALMPIQHTHCTQSINTHTPHSQTHTHCTQSTNTHTPHSKHKHTHTALKAQTHTLHSKHKHTHC